MFLFRQGIAYSSRAEEQKFGCALTAVAIMRLSSAKETDGRLSWQLEL